MTTLAQRGSGTPVTNGTTWATTTNAVDGAAGSNPATYATWTSSTSGATAYIEVGNYSFAAIPDTATLNSVTVSLRHLVNNTGRYSTIRFQPYLGATPLGTIANATITVAAHNDQSTFVVTLAQLKGATFKVRATATRAAVTQSGVWSVDYIDVTADYTPLGGKPKVWTGAAWVEKPVKVWTGSAWVEKPLKVWTGSAWVLA